MKLTLITPRQGTDYEKNIYDYRYVAKFIFSKSYSGYLLAIPTLAALTPSDIEVKVTDENIEPIDFDAPTDLVGISVRTMFAKRAYEIASKFRKRGVKVVLGGIHTSMVPDEACQYADSIVVGEAEGVWQELLQDFKDNRLQKVYKRTLHPDLTQCPMPNRSLLKNNKYLLHIVQTTKGCPFFCEFCSVHAFDGTKIRHRSLEQVITDIKETQKDGIMGRKKAIFFADDNIVADRKYAKAFFKELTSHGVSWSCQASINVSRDDEILDLMAKSGCGGILIGFESIAEDNLRQMNKKINLTQNFSEAIQKIHSHGMLVQGSFIVGHDNDTKESFKKLAEFINNNNVLFALISILTPFPGTALFKRLEKDGRILNTDWERYDSKTVVFKPKNITPLELKKGLMHVYREVYSFKSIYRKLKYFWERDFWKEQNRRNPIKFKYRILFALRLLTYLPTIDFERIKFIFKILPWVFDKRIRLTTIITLMAYNDYAYSLREE
ncbi:MAG TPA: B12-binding domain-containing radical SAM protein [Deltaproteobacteria bacterium]|nr:B12-binding domain-containing radical SAM protein [Deltaproteobacteria bacterium]